jgi:hypothetical protein
MHRPRSRAHRRYSNAAESGHVESMHNLAVCYKVSGRLHFALSPLISLSLSAEHFFVWLPHCAFARLTVLPRFSRHDFAAGNVGACAAAVGATRSTRQLGSGVAQDDEKALGWFEKAGLEGDADSAFAAARIHGQERKDLTAAAKWFGIAADFGDTRAMFNLGTFYHRGLGVTPSVDQALEWCVRLPWQPHGGTALCIRRGCVLCVFGVRFRCDCEWFVHQSLVLVWRCVVWCGFGVVLAWREYVRLGCGLMWLGCGLCVACMWPMCAWLDAGAGTLPPPARVIRRRRRTFRACGANSAWRNPSAAP